MRILSQKNLITKLKFVIIGKIVKNLMMTRKIWSFKQSLTILWPKYMLRK